VEVPISLIVGVLLLSLGVGVAAVLRTFMNSGRLLAIERILEPMPEVHCAAAELRARVDGNDKQIEELKKHLERVRIENLAEHKLDREEDARAHDRIERLIVERNEKGEGCEPKEG
jgi:predicted RNase H-like nuclease (RuvC/YqgF family)